MDQLNIKEQLKLLIGLQEIDKKRYELKEKLKLMPEEMNILEQDFESKKSTLNQKQEQLKLIQVKHKDQELALAAKEEDIKKHQTQLFQIKTNKEYTAKLTEIESLKADCSAIEDEILKALDEIQSIQEAINQEKQKLQIEEKKLQEAKQEVTQKINQSEQELNSLNEQREQTQTSIDPKLLSQYERVLENKEGLALVSVNGEICGGCHMNLPPQVINEIRMGTKLISCENCSRILYVEEKENIDA